jgi:hypothetical protein
VFLITGSAVLVFLFTRVLVFLLLDVRRGSVWGRPFPEELTESFRRTTARGIRLGISRSTHINLPAESLVAMTRFEQDF